ncbi:hypothetical protein LCGC14_2386930 [marine sediment metagenome]|uniref:Uncharacterized protein n=1 Tax=marine sediment metagenome TaxID=412755 RepID=A0A0F9EBP8_9ZZZZ
MFKQKYKYKVSIDIRDISKLLDAYEDQDNTISDSLKTEMNQFLDKIWIKIIGNSEDKDKEAHKLKKRIVNVVSDRKPCAECHNYRADLYQIRYEGTRRHDSKHLCSKCLQKKTEYFNNAKGIYRTYSAFSIMKPRRIVDCHRKGSGSIEEIYDLISKHGIKNVESLVSNLDFASMSLSNKRVDSKLSNEVYYRTKKDYFEYERVTLDKPLLNPHVQEFFLKHYEKVLDSGGDGEKCNSNSIR